VGPEVRKLQEKLNEHGAGLGVDGIFGRGTQAAVMAFQAANGLEVDGIVGRKTWTALGV
jgi:peptidoglycan hydrolase-like protein with peptidoglycan-binding domain